MSKLSVLLERVGGVSAVFSRLNDAVTGLSLKREGDGGIGKVELDRQDGSISSASLGRIGGMTCTLAYAPDIPTPPKPVEEPYLEIQPTMIWLNDWGAYNAVHSNTEWIIN